MRLAQGFSGMAKRPKPRNERKASRRPAGIPGARRKVVRDDAAPEGEREPDECDEIGPEGGYGGAGPDQDHPLR